MKHLNKSSVYILHRCDFLFFKLKARPSFHQQNAIMTRFAAVSGTKHIISPRCACILNECFARQREK